MVTDFLTSEEVVAVASTCKHLRSILFYDDRFWRDRFLRHYEQLRELAKACGPMVDWRWVMRCGDRNYAIMRSHLEWKHITFRMNAPPSSKLFMRLYLKATTEGTREIALGREVIEKHVSLEPQIMEATLIRSGEYFLAMFAPKKRSFIRLTGEGGIDTMFEVYLVDRCFPGNKRVIDPKSVRYDFQRKKTTLFSQKDYEYVGERIYNDKRHFDPVEVSEAHTNSGHSQQRIGKTSSVAASRERPQLLGHAYQQMGLEFSVKIFHENYLTYDRGDGQKWIP